MSLLLQLYAHKLATNPTQEIINSLVVVLSLDKPNLQRRTLRVIKSIVAAGTGLAIPVDVLGKVRETSDKELSEASIL